MSKKISNFLKQDDNKLIAKDNCIITIDLSNYESKDDFQIDYDRGTAWFKGLLCKIEFEEIIFNIILDYPIEIQIYESELVGKNILKLRFTKNSIILVAPLEADILSEQIQYIKRLLGGKEIYKDANHLFLKLLKIYGPLTGTDSVHLELLLSQCLRDKKRIELPARLGTKWDPEMVNMKQIVFNTSFLQGLAFENIGEAIKTGLISEEPTEPSIIEKVLTGDLAPKRKK